MTTIKKFIGLALAATCMAYISAAVPLNVATININNDPDFGNNILISAQGGNPSPNFTYTFDGGTPVSAAPGTLVSFPYTPGVGNPHTYSMSDGTTTLSGTITAVISAENYDQLLAVACLAQNIKVQGFEAGRPDGKFYQVQNPAEGCITLSCPTNYDSADVYTETIVIPTTQTGFYTHTQNENIIKFPLFGGGSLLSSTVVNPVCFGDEGSITITPSGGVAPYTVSVQGANPPATQTVDENQPATFTTPGFSTPSMAFNVTVTDDEGCTDTEVVTLTQPTEIMINDISATPPSCDNGNNGSISFNITGGTPQYSAALTGGDLDDPIVITDINSNETVTFENLPASTNPYAIEVTDANACVITSEQIILSAAEDITINIIETKSPTCFGGKNGSIKFNVSNNATTFTVVLRDNNGTIIRTTTVPNGVTRSFTNLPAGMYSLTASDNTGCTVTQTVTIDDGDLVTITSITNTPISCNGGKSTVRFRVSGGVAPYAACLFRAERLFISCATCKGNACNNQLTIPNVPAGSYTLVVTDSRGCIGKAPLTITQPAPLSFTTSTSHCSSPTNRRNLRVNASGGTSPYSYKLDNGNYIPDGSSFTFNCITRGKHSVTVKDANGCIRTQNIHV